MQANLLQNHNLLWTECLHPFRHPTKFIVKILNASVMLLGGRGLWEVMRS